jgi:P27 family predicted phage terminase small subunit
MSAQLPDELHKLKGTRPTRAAEPEFVVPPSRPRKPKDLTPEGLAVFNRLCSLLKTRRALTAADGELIRIYAVNHVRHAKAQAKIQEEGEVRVYTRIDSNGAAHEIEKENLWLKIAVTCEKNMVACLDRLGLSPLNRAKVKPTAKPKAAEEPLSDFDQFMARTNSTPAKPWVMPPANDDEEQDQIQS